MKHLLLFSNLGVLQVIRKFLKQFGNNLRKLVPQPYPYYEYNFWCIFNTMFGKQYSECFSLTKVIKAS